MRSQTITTTKHEEPERMVLHLKGVETPSGATEPPSYSAPEQSIIAYFRSLPPETVLQLKGATDADEATHPVVSTLSPINVTQVTARSDVQRNAQRSPDADQENWDPSPSESKGTVLISQEDLMAFVMQRILSGQLQTKPKDMEPEECHAFLAESQGSGHEIGNDTWGWSRAGYPGNKVTEDRLGGRQWTVDGTEMFFSGAFDGHGGKETKGMVSDFANEHGGSIMEDAFMSRYTKGGDYWSPLVAGLHGLSSRIKSEYYARGKKPQGLLGGAMGTVSVLIPSLNTCLLANIGDADTTLHYVDDKDGEEIVSVFARDNYDNNPYEKTRLESYMSSKHGDKMHALVKDPSGHTRLSGYMPSSALGDLEVDGMGHKWKIREVPIQTQIDGTTKTLKHVIQSTDGLVDAYDLRETMPSGAGTKLSRESIFGKVIDATEISVDAKGVKDQPAARIVGNALGLGTQTDISLLAPGPARYEGRDDIGVAMFTNKGLDKGTDLQSDCRRTIKYSDLTGVPAYVC